METTSQELAHGFSHSIASRRRRIALLTPGFSSSQADWCIPALLDLVRMLARHDDVTVFALRYPHHRSPYAVHGAAVRPFGGAQTRGPARLLLGIQAFSAIVRAARRHPFDVLHALWAHEPGFLATAAGRLLRIPTVVSILGGELVDLPDIDYGGQRSMVNRWLTRQALRGADRVTVGSRYLADLARSKVPPEWRNRSSKVPPKRVPPERVPPKRVPPERVPPKRVPPERVPPESFTVESFTVAPLGVDLERFHPRRAPATPRRELAGRPKLLQVASLVPVKDQATLLRAFRRVTGVHPAAHLHLVGEGEDEPRLRALAEELAVTANVTFHGAVPHDELPELYRQADLLLVSSRFESQGMVILEALACGCPIAGAAVGLMPELARPEHTCPPQDVPGLERAILGALAERPDAARLRRLVEPYGLAATVERWRRVYESVEDAPPDGSPTSVQRIE